MFNKGDLVTWHGNEFGVCGNKTWPGAIFKIESTVSEKLSPDNYISVILIQDSKVGVINYSNNTNLKVGQEIEAKLKHFKLHKKKSNPTYSECIRILEEKQNK